MLRRLVSAALMALVTALLWLAAKVERGQDDPKVPGDEE